MKEPKNCVNCISRAKGILLLLFLIFPLPIGAQNEGTGDYTLEVPPVLLRGIEHSVTLSGPASDAGKNAQLKLNDTEYTGTLSSDGSLTFNKLVFSQAEVEPALKINGKDTSLFIDGQSAENHPLTTIPAWLSILPPLITIGLALWTKRIIPSLLIGIWTGAWFSTGLTLIGIWQGLLRVVDHWILRALVPENGGTGHMSIFIFTILIAGMVGIIYRNGGSSAVVEKLTAWARTRKRGEIAAGAVGTAIFFDDYSSMLIQGNAVRPMTDKLQTSREKLAYIVDTTAAPVATAALVTTWVGFQVGIIDQAKSGLSGLSEGAYSIFLNSIPYFFYPLFAVIFMWALLISGRDFGPLKKAQIRAAKGDLGGFKDSDSSSGGLREKNDIPRRALNALIPILVLLGVTVGALFYTGSGETVREIIGSADSFSSLLWGAMLSVIAAVLLSLGQKILSLSEAVEAWLSGVKSILEVLIILTLAWAISAVTTQLHAASFLANLIEDTLPAGLLPAIIFLLASATAFATGTSWGTMGILVPLAIPVTWGVLSGGNVEPEIASNILYATVGAVIGGSVWGDHASPISDTSVLSAASSQCGVVEHTNSQLPYALSIGGIAFLLSLLAGFRVPLFITLLIGLGAVAILVFVVADVTDTGEGGAEENSK